MKAVDVYFSLGSNQGDRQALLDEALRRLDALALRLDAVDPQRALDRGFLLALRNGRRAAAAAAFAPGDRLSLLFRDGTVEATVDKTVTK